jgi:N-acetylglucosaminyldiphosphoundecaprenol N-acetyl-beta-D-mannosaminyltransferase
MSTSLPAIDESIRTLNVLGCAVQAVSADRLTDLLEDAVNSGQPCIIANHNLHSLYLYQRDAKLRKMLSRARWTHVDGMGIVLLARLLGTPIERSMRVTYVDWFPLLLERAAKRDWRVFYLGSKPGVADKGLSILRKTYPGLTMQVAHGYFDPMGRENDDLLETIRRFEPDVVMVGMGMPRQEHWIVDNFELLGPVVVLPCGAAIDYVAGEIPTPPRWAGRCGLEWLYRLAAEPGRLWKRYLIEPWFVLLLMGRHWLRSER